MPEAAVGFSICLDWLAQLLAPKLRRELDSQIEVPTPLETDGDIVAAFKEANRLREAGRKIEIV